jgi:beta-galactosidase
MRIGFWLISAAALSTLVSCASHSPPSAISEPAFPSHARVNESFDSDWRFTRGDPIDAQEVAFSDRGWRTLDVPHDWSIEGPFDQNNPTGKSGGFLPAGIGWYRKHFTLPADLADRHVFIEFDGVMANSDVWINGSLLGHRPYGYASFHYDLTGHLNFGADENVLAVRCDNSAQPASRWYTGAGIYRHVRLVATTPVHINPWKTYITTPLVASDLATVRVTNTIVNDADEPRAFEVLTTLYGPGGQAVAADPTGVQLLAAGESIDLSQNIYLKNPKLWNLDQPNLYRAFTQVSYNGQVLDDAATTFGIREFHFDADTGFWLNGKNIKIYGCALHADGGAVGSAVPLGVWERRLALLKSVGCNAIRTAHNPPSPEFLDLCDHAGFLVMDEMFDVWTVGKTPLLSRTVLADYHLYYKDWWQTDVTDTVLRDRNHPSIILWSAGNEIHDINPNNDLGARIFVPLRDLYHQLDPSRPVTLAVLRPNINHVYDNGFSELMDVVGQNYRENELLAAHQAMPTRKIIGTENHHDVQTWRYLRDNAAMSGQFLWTGVDYLGESARWPIVSSSAGLFDRTGWAKPLAFQRRSWWTTDPMVRIARLLVPLPRPAGPPPAPGVDAGPPLRPRLVSDWTVRPGAARDQNIEVYTNCQEVELFLNGKSLGTQKRHADDTPLLWHVAYQPGELKAISSNDGKPVAEHILRTAAKPAAIKLWADQLELAADWDDVSFVEAKVVDANGITVPDAADLIHFQLSGPGLIAAVDNGDPSSHESFQASERHVFQGHCVAIVRATGEGQITLSASAAGLAGASASIDALRPTK